MTAIDGRRAKGTRSRAAVLERAVNLASEHGLESLSIGGLASEAALSKSGVVALFGSKEQLQLATIDAARQIFIDAVITPSLEQRGGRERIDTLIDTSLEYSRTRVFSGGCFFAAVSVEYGSKSGAIHDAVVGRMDEWFAFVRYTIARAIHRGELAADFDADQLAFETVALIDGANARSVLTGSDEPYDQARKALARLFDARG